MKKNTRSYNIIIGEERYIFVLEQVVVALGTFYRSNTYL